MPESKSGALPLGDAPARRPRINQPGRGANPAKWPEGRDFCPVAGGGGHSYKGASRGEGPSFRTWLRRVAQPGRALRSGRRGRRFESSLSDHFSSKIQPIRAIWSVYGQALRAFGRDLALREEMAPKRYFLDQNSAIEVEGPTCRTIEQGSLIQMIGSSFRCPRSTRAGGLLD